MPFSVILVFKSFMVRSSLVFLILLPKRTVLYCYFHMCCALTDPKFLCCLTHRSLRFNYIIRNFHCPLFNIILQKNPSACIFLQCMQRDFGVCLIKLSPETSHSVLPASLFYFLFPFIAGFLFPENVRKVSCRRSPSGISLTIPYGN